MAPALAVPAMAQTCDPNDPTCPPPPPPPPEPRAVGCDISAITDRQDLFTGAACSRSVVNPKLLIHQVDVIRHVTWLSFGITDAASDAAEESVEPAGLGNLTAEEAAARVNGGKGDLIIATADVVEEVPAASRWNLWIDGKYTHNDSSPAMFDLDGPLVNVLGGADFKFTDRITLGVLGSYEESDLEGSVGIIPPEIDSSGWGIGTYFGVVLTPSIVWSGSYLYSEVESDQNDFFFFDAVRHQASTAVTGYLYKNTFRFSPSLSLAWGYEEQEEVNGLTADQTIETLILTPSLQIGNTFSLAGSTTVEPWLGAALDAVLVNKVDDAALGNIIDDPYEDLRLQAGLNFSFGSNAQLAITGEIAGLLVDTSDSYSVEANLAIQF